jgi:integrase
MTTELLDALRTALPTVETPEQAAKFLEVPSPGNSPKVSKRTRNRSGKKAWVFQYAAHVRKYGDKASWYVGWIDPNGKRRAKGCGRGESGRKAASKLADKRHVELASETYGSKSKATWEEFYAVYQERVIDRAKNPQSAGTARRCLSIFRETMKPKLVRFIDSGIVEDFVAKRIKQAKDDRRSLSMATVNRDLRYLRHALKCAKRWKYITEVPEFPFEKLEERLPTYVPADHFKAIYAACDAAKRPKRIPNVAPSDWWRALIVLAYMTGWRIGQILALKWEDINLERGIALSQAADNKGKRDCEIPLHPFVVEHLRKIQTFGQVRLFPWNGSHRALWAQFGKIQEAARLDDGKPLPMGGKFGRRYGFHDLRRGFATNNAANMDLFELQGLMQHKNLETTKLYVNMANRLAKPVERLYVPDIAMKAGG